MNEQLPLRLPQTHENLEKGLPPQPTKPTKPGFDGFVGYPSRRISEIRTEAKPEEDTPPRGLFEDIKTVLRVFPGSRFLGVYGKE